MKTALAAAEPPERDPQAVPIVMSWSMNATWQSPSIVRATTSSIVSMSWPAQGTR